MPLRMPAPPSGVPETVRSNMRAMAEEHQFSTERLREAQRSELDVSTPHQVFALGLEDIESGAGLEAARPVGWRYLVTAGTEVIASAESPQVPDGTPQPPHFTEGRFVAATDAAVRAAEALPQVAKGPFELRLLRIPALYLMALWLHSPATDLLLPLAPSPVGREGQITPPAQLFGDLARQARERAEGKRGQPDHPTPSVP